MVANYVAAGVKLFVVARSIRDQSELQTLRDVLPFRLRVVRLTVTLQVVEERLRADVTTGRQGDLRVAAQWLAESVGTGLEDLAVANDHPIRQVALEIVEWLRLSFVERRGSVSQRCDHSTGHLHWRARDVGFGCSRT